VCFLNHILHHHHHHHRRRPPLGEIKGELTRLLTDIVARHQAARAQVTEQVVDAFMAPRPMHDAFAASGRRPG
jgi:tryptophanyl-tRNA synthetase